MTARRLLHVSLVALLALPATAIHAAPRHSSAAAPAGPRVQLSNLSAAALREKIRVAKVPRLTGLFPVPTGDELPPMPGHMTHDGFELHYRGIKAGAFGDGDGGDEASVWVAVVRPTAQGYTKSVHRVGDPIALSSTHPTSVAGAAKIFDGERTPCLMVGAVIEDDDGSAAQWLAELDVLLEQAIAAATLLRDDDEDPLDTLHATIELGRVMFGADPGRPDIGVRRIGEDDWDLLWDKKPTIEGGDPSPRFAAQAEGKGKSHAAPAKATPPRLEWKVSLSLAVGAGRYDLVFDVPAPAGRKPRRLVRVEIKDLDQVTTASTVAAESDFEYVVRACISTSGAVGMNIATPAGTNCLEKVMPSSHAAGAWEPWLFSRRMRQGKIYVNVFAFHRRKSGQGYKYLDLDDGKLGFVQLDTNTTSSPVHLVHDVTGDGEGGGTYNSACYTCRFPSGEATGRAALTIDF